MAFGEGENRRQTTVGKGDFGRGMRIATTSDIGHWSRNDTIFCKGNGGFLCGA